VLRELPHNLDIEKAALGCMLIEKNNISLLKSVLQAEDFYKAIHSDIYKTIIKLDDQGKPVDLLTLTDELQGSIEPSMVIEIMNSTQVVDNAKAYAKRLREYRKRRDIIKYSEKLQQKAYEGDYTQELKAIEHISVESNDAKLIKASELINETLSNLEEYQLNGGVSNAISTGFTELDNKIIGVKKGDLTVVAARPSMGKTAFMMNLTEQISIKQKKPAALFSMEMSKEQIMHRLVSSISLVDSSRMQRGKLSQDDWGKIALSTSLIGSCPLYIDDATPQTVSQIKAKCKEIKGLEVVFIDYLDYIMHEGKTDNRVQQISEITKGLKIMAKQLNVAVVLLVQLSRACEQRLNKRPVLSDLRDSGAIEQDADLVLFLYRDEYYNPDTDKKNIGEVITAKNRNGQTGTSELVWLGSYTKFTNKQTQRN
jgi:replicative DNA helicase